MVRQHRPIKEYAYEQTLGDSGGQGSLGMLQSMESQRVRHHLATEQ